MTGSNYSSVSLLVCIFFIHSVVGQGICPDGRQPIICLGNPSNSCNRGDDSISCLGYPDAICVPDICDECNAVFYDPRTATRVDCTGSNVNPTRPSRPDDDERRPQGGNVEPTRPSRPDDNERQPPGREICLDGSEPVACDVNPCEISECLAYPDAICVPKYCGGCKADFYDARRRAKVNCTGDNVDPTRPSRPDDDERQFPGRESCRDGSEPVACDLNPCEISECLAYPDALCVPNYCGGCEANFYDPRRLIKVNCTGDNVDPTRPSRPDDDERQFPGRESCRDGSEPVACDVNPCEISECLAYPDALCVPDYCGGCEANFFDPRRRIKVNCTGGDGVDTNSGNDTRRPDILNCPEDMQVTVPPNMFFVEATWDEPTALDSTGQHVALQDKNVIEPRRYMGVGETTTVRYVFEDRDRNSAICSFIITAVQGSDVNPTRPSRPDEGDRIPPERETCLDGSEPVACDVNPCDISECLAYPDAVCVSRSCGGCSADFYDLKRRIKVNCSGADGVDTNRPPVDGVDGTRRPDILNCPEDMQVTVPPNIFFVEATWDEPTALDSKGQHVALQDKNVIEPRRYMGVGETTTVRYVFEDRDRNSATCSFIITAVQGSGLDNLCHTVDPCPSGQTCFYSPIKHDKICIPSANADRIKRDVPDLCRSDSCGPHSSCVTPMKARKGYDFICVCDEGWQTKDCYTAHS